MRCENCQRKIQLAEKVVVLNRGFACSTACASQFEKKTMCKKTSGIQFVETYRGWSICLAPAGYHLVIKEDEDEYDYEQIPLGSVDEAKRYIDDILAGTALTAEEADRVYDESPADPMTPEEIEDMVHRIAQQ